MSQPNNRSIFEVNSADLHPYHPPLTRLCILHSEGKCVHEELDGKRQLRQTENEERVGANERDEGMRTQLGDITQLVSEQRDECTRKRELMMVVFYDYTSAFSNQPSAMGRTKQVPRKSTGGPAKRSELPMFKKITLSAGSTTSSTPIIKTVTAASPKTALLHDKPKPMSHNIYWFGSSPTFLSSTAFFAEMAAIFMTAHAAQGQSAKVALLFQRSFGSESKLAIYFICAGCHEKGSEKRDEIKLYFGFEDAQGVPILDEPATIHGHAEMTSWSQICSDSILILHFVLRTVDPFGSPTAVMRDILQPYKPNDHLQYHEIIFDFGMVEKFEKHVLMMQEFVKQLEQLRFDPEGRNKVTTPGLPVAYTVDDFFQGLLAGGIEKYVKGSTLWMLVCGHMVREGKVFNVFKDYIKRVYYPRH
ncbi:hypothetical protein P692DRAFT_201902402 [Suillus brevipes Sb2]|nr:hypothetical protein P692DRAFT_201902402 [Suillus brevipes Sb2]